MFYTDIKQAAQRYAAYRRTKRALRNLPLDTALDLGIYQGDANRIASRAVYGA